MELKEPLTPEQGEELRQLLGLPKLNLRYYEDLSQEEKAQIKAEYEERNGVSISYEELEATYKGVIMKVEGLKTMKEEFTVITRGLNDAIADNEKLAKEVLAAYSRFKAGDWGDTCEEDKPLNDAALAGNGDRIVAKYNTCVAPIFIINSDEPYDTAEDGSVIVKRGTTLLFCDEY